MRKVILFITISLLLINTNVIGQITITQTDMPNAGDSVRVSYSTSIVDPTLTGTSYTWDFSTLVPDLQTVEVFDSPTSFAFPYNAVFNILNTSYGVESYTPDSIGGIQPSDAFNYYKESSSSFKQIGLGVTINAIPIPILYQQPDFIYRFPMNYGNTDSSDAYYEFNIPGIGTYGQFIHRVNMVDGWGQLTTPFGTVASLRIKSMIHTKDTINLDTLGTGYAINRPLRYEYKWLSANGKIPYLEIDANDIAGIPVVSNIIYQDIFRPGTFQLGTEEMNTNIKAFVYPNPASEMIFLTYHLTASTDIHVDIFDMRGKVVMSVNFPNGPVGTNLQSIYLGEKNIAPGAYVLKISGKGFSDHQQVIIK